MLKKYFRSGVVFVILSSLMSTVFISSSSASTPGELDASFGTGGKVTTAIGTTLSGSNIAEAMSVVMDSNGKIVVAGYAYFGSNVDFALARYLSNGTLDTSFGTGGIVTTPVGTAMDTAQSIAIDSSGKIVVAGYVLNGLVYDIAVVRYLSNGDLDLSFSTDGKVTTPVGTGIAYGFDMAIDSSDKIIVAGSSENALYNDDITVVRYNSNGTLDSSFGTGGIVTTGIGSDSDQARSLAIDGSGKIVIAGQFWNGMDFDFVAARYLSNGTLDPSFGTDGKVTTAIGPGTEFVSSIAIESSGKIVVAGYSENGTNNDIAVVRYLSNGDLDLSFSTDGKVTTAIGTASDLAFGMAIDASGKIVVTGYSENGPNDDVALARYNSNGTLDSSFGTGGIVTTSIRDGDNWGRALTFDSNGKIVIVGFSETVLNFQFAVLRLNVEDSAAIAAAEAARVAAAAEAARVAAAAEAARVAAAAEAAKKAQEQKELLAILGLLPPIGGISVNVGDLAKSLLSTKCTKGKSIKYVKKGTKCPKGYARKK